MKSFRELDEAAGRPKGSAFRVFKQLAPGLAEGRDFWLLKPGRDDEAIAALRQQRRIYSSSVNVVLLADDAAAAVAAQLAHKPQMD